MHRSNFLTILSLYIFSSLTFASEDSCLAAKKNIIDKIECLNDVSIISNTINKTGKIVIDMLIDQPMDHDDLSGTHFKQRIVLIHENIDEPMLLQTSGYSIFKIKQAYIARVFETNQIQIEHRYFANSIPSNPDWSYLNIRQSAADFHKVTAIFKKIYKKAWVNTGASKGGMTSTYHRYFYPNDVVGTVADVAPLSFSTSDQRYITFIENIGGDEYKLCRDSLKEMQQTLLINRDLFLPNISGDFTQIGGKEVAFEHYVIEAIFYFWQYGKPTTCKQLPDVNNVPAVYAFFQKLTKISRDKDTNIHRFMAYFYQSATELGGPDNVTAHLEELRYFEFSVGQYTPHNIEIPYSNASMREIKLWALNDADEVMYIYGAFDPWTAGEYPVSISGKNTYKFYIPAGNHSANFTQLKGDDKKEAISILTKWLGKAPAMVKKSRDLSPSLEQIEFLERKAFQL